MTTRYDVSAVPMQGGYIAKFCPVRAQNDALHPAEPLPPSPALERLWARGRAFEDEIVADLLALHPEAVLIESRTGEEREAATLEAMRAGVPLVLGGRLPSDPVGRRVGLPDLLVAAPGGGYRPVDVKHHRTLDVEPARPSGIPALRSELAAPGYETAEESEGAFARKRKEDLLQLAHYRRMLETAGLAAPDAFAGIIGVERAVAWYDLDAAIWRTPSSSGRQRLRTTMEVYDFEFDFRLDVIALALDRSVDPSRDLLVPVRIPECGECPWWGWCGPQLERGSGDVSLVPGVRWREWKIHRDRGITDRAALAALHHRTARLVAAGVDVADLLAQTEGPTADTPIAGLPRMRQRPAQLERLRAAGITTVGDVDTLSSRTAAYSGISMSSLPDQIDQARAALGPSPAYRRRGVEAIVVPRADVEVDLDVETIEEGIYLWGTLLTDRSGRLDMEPGYRAFVTWEALSAEEEVRVFLEFWTWLTAVRATARDRGRTFAVYRYSDAETGALRRLGAAAELVGEVEELVASASWVDLLPVVAGQLVTGRANGLKLVAPLAGFAWEVEDPGGMESMVRYDPAVGATTDTKREESRAWLLAYNQGDVEATAAVREWLDRDAPTIPPVESLGE